MILKNVKVKIENRNLITNCYIIVDEDTKEAMVIDPGAEADKIIDMIDILGAKVKYIILTHCHADHIGGIAELKEKKGGKILISRDDSKGLYDTEINLDYYVEMNVPELEADSRLDDEDVIHIGNLEFKIILTPGHTKGGICIYNKEHSLMFTGDTIFAGTWGRTDLPTGNIEDIMNSIEHKILIYPDDTILYPGHGRTTLIGDEKSLYFELKRKEF
ncbi:MAG: MBL fold metallo-hydrolase [Clostridia bacterium]|nr:MBL fold metallo-hydrolase [Clostridia bacterium]